jgi:hypothetical protein
MDLPFGTPGSNRQANLVVPGEWNTSGKLGMSDHSWWSSGRWAPALLKDRILGLSAVVQI